MVNHWIVPCRRAVVDAESNSASLLDIVEEIRMPRPPEGFPPRFAVPLELNVMGYWERDDADPEGYEGRLLVIGPDGDTLGEGAAVLDFQGRNRLRTRTNFVGFPISGEGRYLIRSEVREPGSEGWHIERSVPILVIYT